MDNFIYQAIDKYFKALSKLGSFNYKQLNKLLVLIFYYHLVYEDYRGYISKEDYRLIEKALNCLYGTNCLIPYPDYLKMGKLHLGEMTEMATRIKNLEDTPVIKVRDLEESSDESDIEIIEEE